MRSLLSGLFGGLLGSAIVLWAALLGARYASRIPDLPELPPTGQTTTDQIVELVKDSLPSVEPTPRGAEFPTPDSTPATIELASVPQAIDTEKEPAANEVAPTEILPLPTGPDFSAYTYVTDEEYGPPRELFVASQASASSGTDAEGQTDFFDDSLSPHNSGSPHIEENTALRPLSETLDSEAPLLTTETMQQHATTLAPVIEDARAVEALKQFKFVVPKQLPTVRIDATASSSDTKTASPQTQRTTMTVAQAGPNATQAATTLDPIEASTDNLMRASESIGRLSRKLGSRTFR